jgi:hydrogenase nickel incorporation protein HypA/HybF
MHEFSIASSIADSLLEFAEARGISKIIEVRLAVGELACVAKEQLRFCYHSIAKDTPIENSDLIIDEVPARVKCPHCAYHGPPTYWDDALYLTPIPTMQCPECGQAVQAEQGHECTIKTIKYAA